MLFVCAICLTERTFIHEIEGKYDLENELEIYLRFFTDWCYERTWRLIAWSVEKILKIQTQTKTGTLIMKSKCADYGIKKSRFVKEQEANGLLSSLGLKIRLSKIPLFSDTFFWVYKINEIVYKSLLADDKFMPEMHLKQPWFTYSACGPCTRNKERIENLCREDTQILFSQMSLIKLLFNVIGLMINHKT